MIDPWKNSTIPILGKKAGEQSISSYTSEIINIEPKLKEGILNLKQQIAEGKRNIIENSNELFL